MTKSTTAIEWDKLCESYLALPEEAYNSVSQSYAANRKRLGTIQAMEEAIAEYHKNLEDQSIWKEYEEIIATQAIMEGL